MNRPSSLVTNTAASATVERNSNRVMVLKVSCVAVGPPLSLHRGGVASSDCVRSGQLPSEITPNGPSWSLPDDTHEVGDMLGRCIRQEAVPYVEDMRAIVQRS